MTDNTEQERPEAVHYVDCDHQSFRTQVFINQDDGTGLPTEAKIRISCQKCGLPVCFSGVNFGLFSGEPTVNADNTELKVQIHMKGTEPLQMEAKK